MAIALLAGTLLALAGFLLTSVQGFAVAAISAVTPRRCSSRSTSRTRSRRCCSRSSPSRWSSSSSSAPAGSSRTRRGVRRGRPPLVLAPSAASSAHVAPATFALLSAIAVFVLGGAVHTHGPPLVGPPRRVARGRRHAPLGARRRVGGVHREREADGRPRRLRASAPVAGAAACARAPPCSAPSGRPPSSRAPACASGARSRSGSREPGADVAVHYRGSAGRRRGRGREIRASGRRAAALRPISPTPRRAASSSRAAVAALGGLDFLVHSAANFARLRSRRPTRPLWDAAMDLNARAAYLMAREAAPSLRARRGRVVLISDVLAIAAGARLRRRTPSRRRPSRGSSARSPWSSPRRSPSTASRPGRCWFRRARSPEPAARWARRPRSQRNGSAEDVAAAVALPLQRAVVHHGTDPPRRRRQVAAVFAAVATRGAETPRARLAAPGEVAHELPARRGESLGPRSVFIGAAARLLDRVGHLEDVEALAVGVGEAARDAVGAHRLEAHGVVDDLLLGRRGLRLERASARKSRRTVRVGTPSEERKISVRLRWPIRETHFSWPEKTARRKSRSASQRLAPRRRSPRRRKPCARRRRNS